VEGEYSGNIMYSCENGKMRHVETSPGMAWGQIKENDGGCEFNYDIRTVINVTMNPQYNNNIIKIKQCK
jgi:hypothetical protein